MNIFKKIYLSTKLALWRISASLANTEQEILKPKDLTDTNEKKNKCVIFR